MNANRITVKAATAFAKDNGLTVTAGDRAYAITGSNGSLLVEYRVDGSAIGNGRAHWRLYLKEGTFDVGYAGEAIKAAADYLISDRCPAAWRRVK